MSKEPELKAGDVLGLGPEAGILYGIRPLTVRVIQVLERVSSNSAWITAYELDERFQAVVKRELYLPNLNGVDRISEPQIRSSVPPPARRRRTAGAIAR